MAFLVRRLRAADARAVAELRIAAWRAAYGGLVPDTELAAMDLDSEADRIRAQWTVHPGPDGPWSVVACTAGTVAGFATWGPYRRQPNHAEVGAGTPATGSRAVGEVYGMCVHPQHWGTGAGHALMTEALDTLGRDGFAPVRLWVLTGNLRARQFYERAGFHADGASALFHAGEARVPELRYTRD
jgi:GNAT superfamily N-acetyltransferase